MKFKLFITFTMAGFLVFSQSCQTNSDYISTTEIGANAVLAEGNDEFNLNRSALNKTAWFTEAYNHYKPDTKSIDKLKENNKNLSFVVFGGSWCSDTKKVLPTFYKITDLVQIPANKIALHGVDYDKHSLEKDGSHKQSKKYNIQRVPTFIVFYNGSEIGRLYEKAAKTLEEDIVALVEKSGR